jgi:hypothetical protein
MWGSIAPPFLTSAQDGGGEQSVLLLLAVGDISRGKGTHEHLRFVLNNFIKTANLFEILAGLRRIPDAWIPDKGGD